MVRVLRGYYPSLRYYHNPARVDKNGNTVAMLCAKTYHLPPLLWFHDPKLINNAGETVAILLI